MQITKINEIFRSIQGEGFFAGTPCVFIRLQGCLNKCEFCDTPHARNPEGGMTMTVSAILDDVKMLLKDTKIRRIVITGGEPFLQSAAVRKLCEALHNEKYHVAIESSGTVPLDSNIERVLQLVPEDGLAYESRAYLTLSPKHEATYDFYLRRADEVKILVGRDEKDDPPIPTFIQEQLNEQTQGKSPVHFCFQPIMYECLSSDDAFVRMKAGQDSHMSKERAIALCIRHGVHLSTQLHKYLNIQ